jgi:hypothetical protein
VDLDPAPHNSDANLRPLLHFEPPRLQYERLRPL